MWKLENDLERNQPYLFVVRYVGGYSKDLGYKPEGTFMLSHNIDKNGGDFFHCSDFEPYQEKEDSFYVVGFLDDFEEEFAISGGSWQKIMNYDDAMQKAEEMASQGSTYEYYVLKAIAKVEYVKPKPIPPVIVSELK